MRRAGQSGAGMLFSDQEPVRTWSVLCPPGMLAFGKDRKTFRSVAAFDGYVSEVRKRGFVVTFDNPFFAKVARPDA